MKKQDVWEAVDHNPQMLKGYKSSQIIQASQIQSQVSKPTSSYVYVEKDASNSNIQQNQQSQGSQFTNSTRNVREQYQERSVVLDQKSLDQMISAKSPQIRQNQDNYGADQYYQLPIRGRDRNERGGFTEQVRGSGSGSGKGRGTKKARAENNRGSGNDRREGDRRGSDRRGGDRQDRRGSDRRGGDRRGGDRQDMRGDNRDRRGDDNRDRRGDDNRDNRRGDNNRDRRGCNDWDRQEYRRDDRQTGQQRNQYEYAPSRDNRDSGIRSEIGQQYNNNSRIQQNDYDNNYVPYNNDRQYADIDVRQQYRQSNYDNTQSIRQYNYNDQYDQQQYSNQSTQQQQYNQQQQDYSSDECEDEEEEPDTIRTQASRQTQPLNRPQTGDRESAYFLEQRRRQREQENYQQQEQLIQQQGNHNRYINRIHLVNALDTHNPAIQLKILFDQHYPKERQLSRAIDNIQIRKFNDAFQVVLDCYFVFVRAQSNEYVHYINEIFQSELMQDSLKKQLDIMQRQILQQDPSQTRRIFSYYKELVDSFQLFSEISSDSRMIPTTMVEKSLEIITRLVVGQSGNAFFGLKEQLKQIQDNLMNKQVQEMKKQLEEAAEKVKQQLALERQGIIVQYKDCPCEPVDMDFRMEGDTNAPAFGKLIPLLQNEAYASTELFINNHFFILREDYLRDFRLSIRSLMRYGFYDVGKEVTNNMFIYLDMNLEDVLVNNGLEFKLSFRPYDPRNRQIDWKKTTRLMTGSLLALTNKDLSQMMFASIQKRDIQQRIYDQTGRVFVSVRVLGENLDRSIEQINKLMMSKTQLVCLENKVFFETYIHYLRCLQQMDTNAIPFAQQLVFASRDNPRPLYLLNQQRVYYSIDLKFDLHSNNTRSDNRQIDLFGQWPAQIMETLDQSQFEAVKLMLTNGLALVQGPPGTGKTFCGALAVRILLQNQIRWNNQQQQQQQQLIQPPFGRRPPPPPPVNKPILIVCYTNHALDQFLMHILTFTAKSNIVRIGGRCKEESLQECLLQNNKEKVARFDFRSFYDLRDRLQKKVKNLLNMEQNLSANDCLTYWPQITNKILADYLKKEDMEYTNELCFESKKHIIYLWLDCKKPRDDDFDKIKSFEMQNNNVLRRVQQNRVVWRAPLRLIPQQLNAEIILNEEQRLRLEQYAYDGVNENEQLDSEDEDNRRYALNGIDDDRSRVVQGEVNAAKAYLRRLGFDQEKLEQLLTKLNNPQFTTWDFTLLERKTIQSKIFLSKYTDQLESCRMDLNDYDIRQKQLQDAYIEKDLQFMQTKMIVGVTVTGCAKYASKLEKLNYSIMIIEEAAEVLEAHTMAILSKNLEHLILIGDHQQLKPKLESYFLETRYQTNISLFERLAKSLRYVTLQTQRRMKSKFADFIRLIYTDSYKDHQTVQLKNEITIQGFKSDLVFFNHNVMEHNDRFSQSKCNKFEATMILKCVEHLLKNGYKNTQFTVLAPYVKQALWLKKEQESMKLPWIKIQTIDNYQGEENDFVFLSLVRNNSEGKLGFIGIDNRMCVALSRARIGLFVFGAFDFIEKCVKRQLDKAGQRLNRRDNTIPLTSTTTTDLWLRIIDLAKVKQVLNRSITLSCSSHNKETIIHNIEDWRKVSGGGCSQDCNIRFPCGHICKEKCHQGQHTRIDCKHRCETMLPCGHQCTAMCKKQPCPQCQQQQIKQLRCGHSQPVRCCDDPNRVRCTNQCDLLLLCGHRCQLKCGDDCSRSQCFELVDRIVPTCTHSIQLPCQDSRRPGKLVCTTKCDALLVCGDRCQGTCGSCMGSLHMPCTHKCKRVLLCGHVCERNCGQPCNRCNRPCDYNCCVGKCQKKCGDLCVKCLGKCTYKCEHSNCGSKCWEQCDRPPCNISCSLILPCGCPCLGMCGEQCPNVCREVDHPTKHDAFDIMFGNEDEPDARFYQLECPGKHIFEVTALEQYFKNESEQLNLQGGVMKFLKCPKCQQVISHSSRFNRYIKEVFYNMNEIKKQQNIMLKVSEDELDDLLNMIKRLFIKHNNKDPKEFLGSMSKFIKQQINKLEQGGSCEIIKHEYNCIRNQLIFYDDIIELQNNQIQHDKFEIQKYIVTNDYILNDDFYKLSNDTFWEKLRIKLMCLRMYSDSVKEYKTNKHQAIANISFRLEDRNFMVDEHELQAMRTEFKKHSTLSLEEIRNITAAVRDAGAGHWFKCPNGHYFAIGDCGGATQVSKCADCDAPIGGQSHQLLRTNQHAGEIDGTRIDAYNRGIQQWNNQQ